MKRSFLSILSCPACHSDLHHLAPPGIRPDDEIQEGVLECLGCRQHYPVVHGIPRFVPQSNYADSFGFEWSRYGRVQVDSISGNRISRDRFEATTGWRPGSRQGCLILDAGCGGGRFTEIALGTGATVVALDYSHCVDFTRETFSGRDPSPHLAQADIREMPFRPVFDAVYCMGVLQHTPEPRTSLRCLHGVLKPGGELVVDVYEDSESPSPAAFLSPQAWLWEPLLKRIPRRILLAWVRTQVNLLPWDTAVLRRIERGGAWGRLLRYARMSLPMISNHSLQFPFLTDQYQRLWAEMNTFDRYSPKYTQAQTRSRMRAWAEGLGLDGIEIFREPGRGDGTELVLRGTRRASPPS